ERCREGEQESRESGAKKVAVRPCHASSEAQGEVHPLAVPRHLGREHNTVGAAISLTPMLALLDSTRERGAAAGLVRASARSQGRWPRGPREGRTREEDPPGRVEQDSKRREAGGLPMLPPFIIEQIRQREEKERERREQHQPRLELPLERYPAPRPAE